GDFSKAENHVEQIWEVSQHGVEVRCGATKEWNWSVKFILDGPFTYQIAFMDLTPEVGRILGEWGLKEDVSRCVRHYAEIQPVWYKAHASNRHLIGGSMGEWAGTLATDSYQYFLAHAWIAGTPPEELEHYIDV